MSQKEIERNDAVFAVQNNRNPYVDRPEYVMQVWGNAISVKPEPTAYPSSFSASADGGNTVMLTWTDASGTVSPDGYLLKANLSGNFSTPVDGQPPASDPDLSDGQAAVAVAQGFEAYIFSGLDTSTVYYFSIWPYTNQGAEINYRTSPAAPSDTALTDGGSTSVATNKQKPFAQVRVFPGEIRIQSLQKDQLNIMMFSSTGQVISRRVTHDSSTRLSTAALQHGIYIIKISSGRQQLTKKLIVL